MRVSEFFNTQKHNGLPFTHLLFLYKNPSKSASLVSQRTPFESTKAPLSAAITLQQEVRASQFTTTTSTTTTTATIKQQRYQNYYYPLPQASYYLFSCLINISPGVVLRTKYASPLHQGHIFRYTSNFGQPWKK